MRMGFALAACLLLAACVDTVKSINFRVTDDQSVKTDILMAHPMMQIDRSDLSPQDKEETVARFKKAFEQQKICMGGDYTFNPETGRASFNLSHETYIHLKEALTCERDISERIDVDMTREDHFFTSDTIFSLNLKFPIATGGGNAVKTMVVKMDNPVEIHIDNPGPYVKIDQRHLSDTIVELKFYTDPAKKERLEQERSAGNALCDAPNAVTDPLCSTPIDIKFVSTRQKYGMNELLALIGILCGSGIAVSLASRVLAVRVKPVSQKPVDDVEEEKN